MKHYHEDIIEYSESEIISSQTRDQVLDYIFMMDRAALSYLNLSDVLIGKVISQGNLLDWQWVIDNNFESLYLNGTPEMFTTLSNGGANWLAVFGTEVHQRVFEKFRNDSRIKPFGITNQKIPNSNPPRFPDMVYDTSPSGIKYAEIFELKPITWAKFRDPRKYAMAQRQLNDYVTEYHKANPEVTTSTGTIQTWDVVYHFVAIPKYRSAVVLYQFPDQPGMVYYAQFRTDRSNIDKFVVPMKGRKYKTTVNGNVIEVETLAQDNKTGKVVAVAMIGGAVVLVIGTIVEDVFTVGVGTLDDPASFAAAYLLLQNGITILNQD
ncbi:hypothetical protein ACQKK5_25615 [Brevibacillus panacihumi]|uniref:hypothetical protein n=1 Tax=Brevibacillus panacihumi TaxID=497735 RepID=UPI003D008F64